MKINFLFAAILCLVGTFSLSAQSIHFNYGQDNFLRLELNRPVFSDNFGDVGFFSFASYLNGEFKVGQKGKISFELPYSRSSIEFFGSESNLGNIAIGYQLRNQVNHNYLQFNLRLPTGGDDAFTSLLLLIGDITERFTASDPDLVSIESSYNLESKTNQGLYYRFRPGLQLIIPTEDNVDTELLLNLNIIGGYRTDAIDINAGFTTTSLITEADPDFDDRVIRQFSTNFTYTAGAFKPGLLFRIPLGDLVSDVYDLSIGVHLTYTFGGKTELTSANN